MKPGARLLIDFSIINDRVYSKIKPKSANLKAEANLKPGHDDLTGPDFI